MTDTDRETARALHHGCPSKKSAERIDAVIAAVGELVDAIKEDRAARQAYAEDRKSHENWLRKNAAAERLDAALRPFERSK
jgi:hypothetical protein